MQCKSWVLKLCTSASTNIVILVAWDADCSLAWDYSDYYLGSSSVTVSVRNYDNTRTCITVPKHQRDRTHMVGVIITLWLSLTSHPGITIVTLTACSEIPASDFKLLGDSHRLPARPQTLVSQKYTTYQSVGFLLSIQHPSYNSIKLLQEV